MYGCGGSGLVRGLSCVTEVVMESDLLSRSR